MSEIPFFIVFTKVNKQKIQTEILNESGKNMTDIRQRIVYMLQEKFSVFNHLPESYNEFIQLCWFVNNSADAEPFDYKIFENNKWVTPWAAEDLYSDVYDILHKIELLNAYVNNENGGEDQDEDDDNIEV